MSRNAAEAPGGPSGMREACKSAGVIRASGPVPRTPARHPVAPYHSIHFPVITFLAGVVACLGALFAASIVVEAFDGDLGLWPYGTEAFTTTSQIHIGCGAQGAGASPALQAASGFVMTAGVLLVARYRARSALSSDAPSISVMPFTMAEPWGPRTDWRPGARPSCLRAVRRWWVAKGEARLQWMHR